MNDLQFYLTLMGDVMSQLPTSQKDIHPPIIIMKYIINIISLQFRMGSKQSQMKTPSRIYWQHVISFCFVFCKYNDTIRDFYLIFGVCLIRCRSNVGEYRWSPSRHRRYVSIATERSSTGWNWSMTRRNWSCPAWDCSNSRNRREREARSTASDRCHSSTKGDMRWGESKGGNWAHLARGQHVVKGLAVARVHQ